MTDDERVAAHPLAQEFSSIARLPGVATTGGGAASEIEDTHLAGCFAQMIDWVESAGGPFCLCCHLTGLGAVWDAPLDLRRAYLGEEDRRRTTGWMSPIGYSRPGATPTNCSGFRMPTPHRFGCSTPAWAR